MKDYTSVDSTGLYPERGQIRWFLGISCALLILTALILGVLIYFTVEMVKFLHQADQVLSAFGDDMKNITNLFHHLGKQADDATTLFGQLVADMNNITTMATRFCHITHSC